MKRKLSDFKLSKFTVCFTMALGAGLATAASGQTAPDAPQAVHTESDAGDIEEVVVTARRVEERAQDVPLSMTLFNEEQIAKSNVVNATDLASITPSLSSNNNFGDDNSSFAIRGFVQDSGTAPSVGVYFADVVAPRGATNGTQVGDGAGPGYFFDLQNVEVLKGPQGTLQGRNTTGGSILFVPKKPTSDLGGYVEAGGGNYGMWRTQGAFNAPIGDTLRMRIAIDHQTRDGYLNNKTGIGPDHFSDIDYTALRGSLVWDITPNLENYFIGSYSNSSNNGSIQKMIACNADPSPETNPLGALLNGLGNPGPCAQIAAEKASNFGFYDAESNYATPYSKLQTWQLIDTATWHATDTLTLKNIISYAQLKDTYSGDLFGSDFQVIDVASPTFATHILPFSFLQPPPGLPGAKQNTFTEELHFDGSALDQRFTYQGGVYYERSNPLGESGSRTPFLLSCENAANFQCTDYLGRGVSAGFGFAVPVAIGALDLTEGETTYEDTGLYSQLSYAITQKLKLTGGFRYTWDDQKNKSTRINYEFPGTTVPPFTDVAATPVCADPAYAPNCEESLEVKSKAPTWLLDVDYKPTDDILTYVSYKRGYRSGGVFVNAPSAYNTFKPEKVDTGEIGLKSGFHGIVKGTFDVAAFYNYFRNQQLQIGFNGTPGSGNTSTTAIANAGASRIYGVEVGATLIPVKGLTFSIDYTYLHTEITEINLPVVDASQYSISSHIEKGDPLALSPSTKVSVSAIYTLPLKSSIGKISGGPTFIHTNTQLSNYDYLHSPNTVKYLGGNWGTLSARNILNLGLSWNSIMASGFDVSLFGTNVTHQKYYNFVPGLDGAGFETATVGEPTMYGGSLRYSFGS